MLWQSYLNTAAQLVSSYDGRYPFHSVIKSFFAANKKYGSRDRKIITQLCYGYFRLGEAFTDWTIQEQLLLGWWLLADKPFPIAGEVVGEWPFLSSPKERIAFLQLQFPALTGADIFSFDAPLSKGVMLHPFGFSHVEQPAVFIRVRPGKEKRVSTQLKKAGISFEVGANNCWRLPQQVKLESIVQLDEDVVVQDQSSQQIGLYLRANQAAITKPIYCWDACAASGGKSLLVQDLLQPAFVTATDIRSTILKNYKERMKLAGINNYEAIVHDLTWPIESKQFKHSPNLVIADVPCTGSGTWGRTPEQLRFFQTDEIATYQQLQRSILQQIVAVMRPGNHLLYITCSVFAAENEANVEWLKSNYSLVCLSAEMICGYEHQADSLFAAYFILQ